MSAELIYVTYTDAALEVSAALKAESQDNAARRNAWLDKFNAEYPIARDIPRRFASTTGGGEIVLVEALGSETPPKGFTFKDFGDIAGWMPKRNTRIGKDTQSEWDALKTRTMRDAANDLGMPTMVFVGNQGYTPGVRIRDDGHFVITWGSRDLDPQITKQLLLTDHLNAWREMPRSEYYAWLEAQEAVKA